MFEIINNKIYLKYNLLLIKKLFERDVCANVSSFISWYFQDLNGFSFNCGKCVFIPQKIQQSIEMTRNKMHKLSVINVCFDKDNEQEMSKINNVHVLGYLLDAINFIDKQKDKHEYIVEHLVDRLILGCMYNIIPISQRMEYLLKEGRFCDELLQGQRSYRCEIGWLWQRLFPLTKALFSFPKKEMRLLSRIKSTQNWDSSKYNIHGHPSFCAAVSMKGDFSAYIKLLPFWKVIYDEYRSRKNCGGPRRGGRVFDGIFMVMALYLRDDLALICRNYHGRFEYGIELMLILLQPCLLLEFKNRMVNDFMINFTDEEEYNTNLFKNTNLHPVKRIKFLKLLCFSSVFVYTFEVQCDSISDSRLDDDKVNCIKLYQLISKLVNNFKSFEKEWYLMNYDDLKNDLSKRKELHSQFCLVIQVLFGFRDTIASYRWGKKSHPGMVVNLRPQNKIQLKEWYDEMTKYRARAQICAKLTCVELIIDGEIETVLTFDQVVDPLLLFVKLHSSESLFDVAGENAKTQKKKKKKKKKKKTTTKCTKNNKKLVHQFKKSRRKNRK